MFDSIGEKTFYIFGACNILAIPMVYCLYPETKQRTLEEIESLFMEDSIWAWDGEKNWERIYGTHAGTKGLQDDVAMAEAGNLRSDSDVESSKEFKEGSATQRIEAAE